MDGKKKPAENSPPVKVVGFHVEGASPSPRQNLLSEAVAAGAGAGSTSSPTPMIILPMFPNQGSGASIAEDSSPTSASSSTTTAMPAGAITAAGPGAAPVAGAAAEGAGEGATLRAIRTDTNRGLDPDSFAPDRTPTKAAAGGTPTRPLPLTPIGSAPPDISCQLASEVSSPRITKEASPVLAAPALAPAPAAVVPAPSTVAATAGPATKAASPAKPPALAAPAPAPQQAMQQSGKQQAQQAQQAQQLQPQAQAPPPPQQQQQQKAEGRAVAQGGGAPQAEAPVKKQQKDMTKAERRALQEAQRAAKAAAKAGAPGNSGGSAPAGGKPLPKQGSGANLASSGSNTPAVAKQLAKQGSNALAKQGSSVAVAAAAAAPAKQRGGALLDVPHATRSTELFAHLQQYHRVGLQDVASSRSAAGVPLPAVLLGVRMAEGALRGATARCVAMLDMFVQVIREFKTPPGREFAKEFAPLLNTIIAFLVSCRPLSISMGNAIKAVKKTLEEMKLATSQGEQQDKEHLCERIHRFQEEKIQYALAGVVRYAVEKIHSGDTILTFAYSSVVAAALLAAHAAGKRFTVVVADCRPLFEGRRMLRALVSAGVPCEYAHLNGLSFVLSQVDKVFLGAGAVLSNGTVLSRVGTAAVAMMAAAERLPVLVCCETYKFHERVQLDSITHNELGDPEALATIPDRHDVPGLPQWEQQQGLGLLNLAYDAMPAEFVSVVVTEMGLLPPTSVAVVLREAQRDNAT